MLAAGTGRLSVTASVTRYKDGSTIKPSISKALTLQLVEDAVVRPADVSMFNHPSSKVRPSSTIFESLGESIG